MEGQHIRESPFSVATRSSVKRIGDQISTIERVKYPGDLAVNEMGKVSVIK